MEDVGGAQNRDFVIATNMTRNSIYYDGSDPQQEDLQSANMTENPYYEQ